MTSTNRTPKEETSKRVWIKRTVHRTLDGRDIAVLDVPSHVPDSEVNEALGRIREQLARSGSRTGNAIRWELLNDPRCATWRYAPVIDIRNR